MLQQFVRAGYPESSQQGAWRRKWHFVYLPVLCRCRLSCHQGAWPRKCYFAYLPTLCVYRLSGFQRAWRRKWQLAYLPARQKRSDSFCDKAKECKAHMDVHSSFFSKRCCLGSLCSGTRLRAATSTVMPVVMRSTPYGRMNDQLGARALNSAPLPPRSYRWS